MTCTAVKANVYVMFSLMNTRGKKITTEGETDTTATDRSMFQFNVSLKQAMTETQNNKIVGQEENESKLYHN